MGKGRGCLSEITRNESPSDRRGGGRGRESITTHTHLNRTQQRWIQVNPEASLLPSKLWKETKKGKIYAKEPIKFLWNGWWMINVRSEGWNFVNFAGSSQTGETCIQLFVSSNESPILIVLPSQKCAFLCSKLSGSFRDHYSRTIKTQQKLNVKAFIRRFK